MFSSPTITRTPKPAINGFSIISRRSARFRAACSRKFLRRAPSARYISYRVVGPPGYFGYDLKTLQDWVLTRRFKAVPGVVDVAGWGGKMKAYDVNIDQNKLNAVGISLAQVLTAIGNSDINVGGQTINIRTGSRDGSRWRRADSLARSIT